jgi:hypothetical protein
MIDKGWWTKEERPVLLQLTSTKAWESISFKLNQVEGHMTDWRDQV